MNKENIKDLAFRTYGGIALILGGTFLYITSKFPEDPSLITKGFVYIASGILITEGLGDLISGQHHYLSGKIFNKPDKTKNLEEI